MSETSRHEGAPPRPPCGLADRLAADAAHRARDFIVFCDGVEEAGWVEYARRGRVIAGDALDALDALAAERSVRRAMQKARDRCLTILARQAGDATLPGAFRAQADAALEAEAPAAGEEPSS